MKKLMIALAVVAMAAVSQAASIKWATNVVYAPTSDGTKSSTTKMAGTWYLFSVDSTTYQSYIAKSYAEGSAAIWADYKAGNFGDPMTTKGIIAAVGSGTYSQTLTTGQTEAYLISVLTTTVDQKEWYIANASYGQNAGSQAVTVGDIGTKWLGSGKTGTETIGSWTAVPEPTSGLLLLLGVAGLALKRKRA